MNKRKDDKRQPVTGECRKFKANQPVRELIKRYRIDAALDRKLKAFAKKLQVSEGYTAELAYRVAFNWARFHWDLVFVNGLVREIKPTRADGRVA